MQGNTVNYSRKWYVMIAVAMSILLETIDFSIVNVSLSTLVDELDTTFAVIQWVVLASMLTQTSLMLSIGRLGDMIGKKPIYMAGFVIFMLGAILCGLAPSVGWLIGFRVLQAIGGALLSGLIFAIVAEAFPAAERGKALGMISMIVSIGVLIGPVLGGLILDTFSWRAIFFIHLPIGVIGIVMAWRFVPAFKPVGGQQFDYLGAVSLFICLLSFLLALTIGQEQGFTQPTILLLFANALIFLVIFLTIEWRSAQPMIQLRLFQNNLFRNNVVVRVISFIAFSGMTILIPFYLRNVLQFSPGQIGLLLMVTPICMGTVAPFAGSLSDRFGSLKIGLLGLTVMSLGFFALSTLSAETTVVGYILRLMLVGLGIGIFQSPNNSAIMGEVPREQLGIASGLVSITRTLGSTSGVAVLGAVWAGRTMFHAGERVVGGATAATIAAQVSGLQDTFFAAAILVLVGVAISVWSLRLVQQLKQPPLPLEA